MTSLSSKARDVGAWFFLGLFIIIGVSITAAHGAAVVKPTARTAKQIDSDLTAIAEQIKATLNYPLHVRFDPKYRKGLSPKFIPVLQKRRELLKELAGVSPQYAAKARFSILRDDAQLEYFGDADGASRLDARTRSSDPVEATGGQLGKVLVAWWPVKDDEQAQSAILDDIEKLAKAQPRNDDITETLSFMIETNPATVAVGRRASNLLCKTLKGPAANDYAAKPNKLFEPFAISGTPLKGAAVSTDKWKGKVILIDFWATWCPPCLESLPGLVKLYQDNHDKGFEILGVSSDSDRAALASFLKDHPEMAWPQLFSANSSGGWHPLTKRFGIDGIPCVYLIDRGGILRSLESSAGTQAELVQQLLNEPAPAAPAKR